MKRRYPYLAITAVVIAYTSIATAILLSPWFNWFNNALSDLGNTSNPLNITSSAAWIFDSGLILAGILITLFALLLSRDEHYSWKYVIWVVPLLISTIDLSLIGVFNESFGNIHLVVSIIFFFFTALTLLTYSYVSFPLGTPKTGAVSLILGVLCAAVWVARWPWQGVAIQETVTSLASSALVLLVAIQRVKTTSLSGTMKPESARSLRILGQNYDEGFRSHNLG
ncbi:MAG TPA: DUF998 domain-containing protein [Nitrososphaerales archaeon]|nr:DUF998 domain-containing protein [Nitrososphaerales archaeon]